MSDLREAAERIAADSCRSQGFAPKISDPVVLGKVAALLRSDAPDRRDPIGVKAVEATPRRVDDDVIEQGGEDRPPATEREVRPDAA